MTGDTLQPLEPGSDLNQAVRFYARGRRRSLAGMPRMSRSHFYGIPTATIPAAAFPARDVLVTFWTAIRITGAAPTGLIFEFGSDATAIAAWLNDDEISLRAGDAAAGDRALATFTNPGGSLPVGLELDLVFAVRPGDGRVRIWGNGKEIARDIALGGALPSGWGASSPGAFATSANGTLPGDVSQTGAPSSFDVISPLSVFSKQVPRHFV